MKRRVDEESAIPNKSKKLGTSKLIQKADVIIANRRSEPKRSLPEIEISVAEVVKKKIARPDEFSGRMVSSKKPAAPKPGPPRIRSAPLVKVKQEPTEDNEVKKVPKREPLKSETKIRQPAKRKEGYTIRKPIVIKEEPKDEPKVKKEEHVVQTRSQTKKQIDLKKEPEPPIPKFQATISASSILSKFSLPVDRDSSITRDESPVRSMKAPQPAAPAIANVEQPSTATVKKEEQLPIKKEEKRADEQPSYFLEKKPNVKSEIKPTLILEKYTPKTLKDVVGNEKALADARTWLNNFRKRVPGTPPAILLSGPPGIGKTTIAHLLLKESGYRVVEFNASEERSRSAVVDRLMPVMLADTSFLFTRSTAVVLDEIDGMSGDNGGLSTVVSILKGEYQKFVKDDLKTDHKPDSEMLGSAAKPRKMTQRKVKVVTKGTGQKKRGKLVTVSKTPVICIANVAYSKKMEGLRKICKEIKFAVPTTSQQQKLIERVLTGEGYTFDGDVSFFLSKKIGSPDYRHTLIEIGEWLRNRKLGNHISQEEARNVAIATIDRDSQNVFGATTRLLRGGLGLEESMVTYSADPHMISNMVFQNYPDFIPSFTRANKSQAQIAQAESRACARLAKQADLYSACDRFESYDHCGQVCFAYGTSVLGGGLLNQNQIPGLQTLAFPDFQVHRAQQSYKRLPMKFRLIAPTTELDSFRFTLPNEEFWKKNSEGKEKVQQLLCFADEYNLDFNHIQTIENLTRLDFKKYPPPSNSTFPGQVKTEYGGKGKNGLQALLQVASDMDAEVLAKAIDEEQDEEVVVTQNEIY